MTADATLALNSMIKEWAASGIHIWTTQEAILFLQQDQYRYLLGTGTSPSPATHCCDAFSYNVRSPRAQRRAQNPALCGRCDRVHQRQQYRCHAE